MNIRSAKRREFRKIAEIYKEGFSEKPYNEKWSDKEALNKIKVFSKYCDLWVAEIEGKIAGFLIINPTYWKVGEIAFGEDIVVKKEFRKKDVASKLLKFVFGYYRDKGFKEFMGVINKKAKSKGFIKKLNLGMEKDNILVKKKLK